MKELTHPQKRALTFICDYVEANGFPPTVREVGEELGVTSVSTAHFHLRALHRKGYIEIIPGKLRAIKINRAINGTPS